MGESTCSNCGRDCELTDVTEFLPFGFQHRRYFCHVCNRKFTRTPILSRLMFIFLGFGSVYAYKSKISNIVDMVFVFIFGFLTCWGIYENLERIVALKWEHKNPTSHFFNWILPLIFLLSTGTALWILTVVIDSKMRR
jgi:hypothetical protein